VERANTASDLANYHTNSVLEFRKTTTHNGPQTR
jgi:hypothetical protein